MDMKTITYISDTTLPSTKANSVNIVKVCEAMAAVGQQVELIFPVFQQAVPSSSEIFSYYGVQIPFALRPIKLSLFPGVLYLFAWKVRRLFARPQSDQIFFGRSPRTLAFLSLFGHKVGIDLHGKIWTKNFLLSACISQIAKSDKTQLISFNSKQLEREFLNDFQNQISKGIALLPVPNGANIPTDIPAFEKFETGFDVHVGYIGSIIPGRGIELLLTLAHRFPNLGFHIAGGNEDEIARLGDQPQNVIFYGHIAHKYTYSLRARCDILLAPYQNRVFVSSGENTVDYMSPIKLFEYMSSESAIIASDLPAIREILSDEHAILIAPDNTEAWVDAIARLEDKALRQRYGEAAYQHFLANYTWRKRAEKIINFLHS